MFYITRVKDNLVGVMDTKDGVEEFYSRDDISRIKNSGITILNREELDEVCKFIWHFCMNTQEFGSSEFDLVLDYIMYGGKNQFGGSRGDYVDSLKSDYLNVKKLGFNIEIGDILTTSDMLIKALCDLYFSKRKNLISYNNDLTKEMCAKVSSKWFLNKERITYYYC